MSPNDKLPQVLVVEDEALLLFSIADDLRDAGFEVFEASDADEAIALLSTEPGIGLMFTDIDMPGSMDGLKLSAVVHDRWPPVRIIITSGKHMPSRDRIPDDGLFLPKPYTPASVVSAMNALLS
jgi:two-component system, response regulator PdtaR